MDGKHWSDLPLYSYRILPINWHRNWAYFQTKIAFLLTLKADIRSYIKYIKSVRWCVMKHKRVLGAMDFHMEFCDQCMKHEYL